jgi:aspartokinase-like uncharacterized kinase
MKALKRILVIILPLFLLSCKDIKDESIKLLSDLLDVLKPLYTQAKLKSVSGIFTREYKAAYIVKFNKAFHAFLYKNNKKYLALNKEFIKMGESAKIEASVEFNNIYYDSTEDYDDDSPNSSVAKVSFYELLSEHRNLVSIESEVYDKLKYEITMKKFEIIVLKKVRSTYRGGDFSKHLSFVVNSSLQENLMRNFQRYKMIEKKKLLPLVKILGAAKVEQTATEKAFETIDKSRIIMGVHVKRFIRSDLEKKLGENYNSKSAAILIDTCSKLINEADLRIKELTPDFEKEKKGVLYYTKIYKKEYPVLENLIERWKMLNPIFSFANRSGSAG